MHTTYELSINHVCVARVRVDLSTHELSELWVDENHRRQGLGRRMMKLVCDEADREGVEMYLTPAGSSLAMSDAQLRDWYQRFGFVVETPYVLRRAPKVRK